MNPKLFIDLPDPNNRHRCGKRLGGTSSLCTSSLGLWVVRVNTRILFETGLHVFWMNGEETLGHLVKISGCQVSVWQLNHKLVLTPDLGLGIGISVSRLTSFSPSSFILGFSVSHNLWKDTSCSGQLFKV